MNEQHIDPPTPAAPEVGQTFHFLVSGVTHPSPKSANHFHEVSHRGDEITITQHLLDASRNRLGDLPPWLALLHDPQAQCDVLGHVVTAPGPWPAGVLKTTPGTVEHREARRKAIARAQAIPDEQAREDALAEIVEAYGRGSKSSRTLATYGS